MDFHVCIRWNAGLAACELAEPARRLDSIVAGLRKKLWLELERQLRRYKADFSTEDGRLDSPSADTQGDSVFGLGRHSTSASAGLVARIEIGERSLKREDLRLTFVDSIFSLDDPQHMIEAPLIDAFDPDIMLADSLSTRVGSLLPFDEALVDADGLPAALEGPHMSFAG